MTENNSYLVNNLTIVTLLLAIIYFSKSIFFFFSSNHLISYSPNFCKICSKKKGKNAKGKKVKSSLCSKGKRKWWLCTALLV